MLRASFRIVGWLIVVLACARPCAAQALVQAPQSLQIWFVLDELARAGVQLPADVAQRAVLDYMAAYEAAAIKATRDGLAVKAEPGEALAEHGSPADIKRLQQMELDVSQTERALRDAFFATLTSAARPEDQEVVAASAMRRALSQEQQRMHGRVLDHVYSCPDDITGWLVGRLSRSAPAEEVRHRLLLGAIHGQERIAVLQKIRKMILIDELEAATVPSGRRAPNPAPRRRAPGGDEQGSWIMGRYRAAHNDFMPGGRMHALLTQAQVDAYRALQPLFTEADRTTLMEYWIPRLVGVGWVPDGMPKMYAGSHRVGTYISEFTRCRGLDEGGRERVRAIGRAWAKEDDAIIQGAMQALLYGKPLATSVIDQQRAAAAGKARLQLQAIPGMEWLKDPTATMPTDLGPLIEADAQEFGISFASASRPKQGDGEEKATAPGLPVGYSRRVEQQLGDMLRLTDDQRLLFSTVLADSRERWRQNVQPWCEKARSPDDHAIMRQTSEDGREVREAALTARAKAWEAATAEDQATFEALAAALGERWDARGVLVLRAARHADRVLRSEWPKDPDDVLDVATRVLTTPVSEAGRSAAIAAAAPLMEAWMAAVAAVDTHRNKTDLAGTAWEDKETGPLKSQCSDLAKRVESAVLAAVEGTDRARYQASFQAMARPDVLADPCDVWRAVERLMASAPAEQRTALAEVVQPALDEYDTQWRALAEVALLTKPALSVSRDENIHRDLHVALRQAGPYLAWTFEMHMTPKLPPGVELPLTGGTQGGYRSSATSILKRLAGQAEAPPQPESK